MRQYIKNYYIYMMIALISLIVIMWASCAHAVTNFNIKIGIADSVKSGKLLGSGLTLKDAKGKTLSVKNGAAVSAAGAQIAVGGKKLNLPVTVTAKSGLGWGQTRYRGTLSIIRAGSAVTVVNNVDLENYLRGILKIEMNPEWPQEALKAQAIIARTYAARNRGRFAKRGYDLCATPNSQVYRGVNAEDPRTDRAVSETKGVILTYNGQPADTYYHSDSGGSTADVSHVWGGSRPYLQPRIERELYSSPNSNWKLTLTADQLSNAVRKAGHNVGRVKSLEVAQTDIGGRAVSVKVTGDRGSAVVKTHALRAAVGNNILKSTNFNMTGPRGQVTATGYAQAPTPAVAPPRVSMTMDPLVELTKKDIFTKDETYDMLFNPAKRDQYLKIGLERLKEQGGSIAGMETEPEAEAVPVPQPTPVPKPSAAPSVTVPTPVAAGPSAPGTFTFYGRGWGHGVGLSQWGAKAMADKGARHEEILSHYFPGTKIAK